MLIQVKSHQDNEQIVSVQVADLKHQIERLTEDNRILKEKVNYLLQQRFGCKTEVVNPNQLSLFDDLELPPIVEAAPDLIEVPRHQRLRKGRSKPPADLPRIIIEHDLTEADKQCSCGHGLQRIGEETSEQYDVIPAKFQVIRQVRFKYACPCCKSSLKTAIAPPSTVAAYSSFSRHTGLAGYRKIR